MNEKELKNDFDDYFILFHNLIDYKIPIDERIGQLLKNDKEKIRHNRILARAPVPSGFGVGDDPNC